MGETNERNMEREKNRNDASPVPTFFRRFDVSGKQTEKKNGKTSPASLLAVGRQNSRQSLSSQGTKEPALRTNERTNLSRSPPSSLRFFCSLDPRTPRCSAARPPRAHLHPSSCFLHPFHCAALRHLFFRPSFLFLLVSFVLLPCRLYYAHPFCFDLRLFACTLAGALAQLLGEFSIVRPVLCR